MPAILALDQGTTGSTALVVHQDGTVLGRGYREFTQHYPRPGWVEHDPEEIVRVSLEAMREALARRRRAPRRASASPTSARPWCSGTGGPSRRSRRAIVWQDRRTSERCRELRESGAESHAARAHRPGGRSLLLRHQARVAAARRRSPPARRAGRAGRRHGRELAGGAADRRAGSRHRSHQRLAHAALRSGHARLGSGAARRCSACRRSLLPDIVPSRGRGGGDRRRRTWASSLPIAGLAGDQQAALFGQGCCADGLAKNTYGTGRVPAGVHGRSPARCRRDGRARHRRLRSAGRAGLRARGQRVHRRRGGAVAARRAAA